ncbi:phosphonoacetate hydrolase [Bradyrhizobium sp. U87765 SZCCT0131]|uniref:phosphonoacetate hydrolase n=1 Tax=unclassified Bradyrhizobium TaxID=2631580 RepID=UPI001BA7A62D|nr:MULTISPECIES: phosphonoacetate hydrolase [unclassified Bradyrhizobium]MBR1216982.1 phosphonoacetate hydrolase [Bradyrhizobium sp. U87765 SZCCT0131]MBR1259262.1 phosphonoacetate hydrolase [Bradyrhizobium sp. U87765 SZCCT0134]MBR1305403.1 phosphonoacetate hydrolase [Bradyrhizobium sp. U87765 SZCCT0110]MBR1321189.1 phosphonoacetate hydrolase [Bradyrhizobium sp. U87765 SZCCT0109]MBR1350157.1 phosphonoacetate hydrolase [Bradyrhizobium sp. U87765 SZCCT0048]
MIEVNGRTYAKPKRPTVVVCLDGCDPRYLNFGGAEKVFPNISRMMRDGFSTLADAAMPTFTNPNNVSIVTGAPPLVHGISGNYYLDRATGEEIMIVDASPMRATTILAEMSRAGVRVVAVTAKDKLRKMLGHRMTNGICFSSEKAGQATLADNGIDNVEALVGRPTPDMYSPDLSLFVLDAGIRLLEQGRAELLYLSLSDLVQHGHGPGDPEADAFHRAVDAKVGRLAELGAVVGLIADHGMNDKINADGTPRVVFLEEELNRQFGPGAVRVICPITDPFVKHHGALGSFVRVYLRARLDLAEVMDAATALPGIALVLDGESAARRYQMPLDREGDFVAIGDTHTVIGSSRAEHDLAGLKGHRLRSHGGLSEQIVPFILSHPVSQAYREVASARRVRNFDIFDFALNGALL